MMCRQLDGEAEKIIPHSTPTLFALQRAVEHDVIPALTTTKKSPSANRGPSSSSRTEKGMCGGWVCVCVESFSAESGASQTDLQADKTTQPALQRPVHAAVRRTT